MCSCRGLRWHEDSGSTRGPLRGGIGCPCPGPGSKGGLCGERPERLGGHLPASQGQPTTRGQRAADPLLRGTGRCCHSPVHLAPRTARTVGSSSSFLLSFPAQTSQRIILPHQGLQHVAWAFHPRDIPAHYRNRPYLPKYSWHHCHERRWKEKASLPQNAFPFTLERVISNTADSSLWPFSEGFSFTESAKS